METHEVISFIQDIREKQSQHAGFDPPEQASFTFEKPHTCGHCETVNLDLAITRQVFMCWECRYEGVGKPTDSGQDVCYNCGRSFPGSGGYNLQYSAVLDHNVHQAADAARSGCEFYRWITYNTARGIHLVTKKWETSEAMDAIATHCRFDISAMSWMGPGPGGQCSLTVKLVCGGTASGAHLRHSTFLGVLSAWAAAGEPASKYISSRPYERDVKSQDSMRFANQCFRTCMESHPWCRTDQIGHLSMSRKTKDALPREKVKFSDIPTRLVDVGTQDSPHLKLVETAEGDVILLRRVSEVGFMALSYCWGGDQPAKLLKANLTDYKKDINFSRLSKTLQEVVLVARATGFQYLWIDSLCICQDDEDGNGNNPDKNIELTRMASYYGRSTITLCAASAEKAVDGFLSMRGDPTLDAGPIRIQLRLKEAGKPIGYVYLVQESDFPPTEPTTTRGWTLQESLLSRRILIFGQRQLYWSCLNSFGGCGGSIVTLTDRTIPGVQSLVEGIYPVGSLIDQPTWAQWGAVIADYTKRKLGRDGDKLWALSALAQHMVAMSKTRGEDPLYAAGLLVNQYEPGTWLPQLLWHPDFMDSRRPSSYRAPSWSWASVEGHVKVPSWSRGLTEYAAVTSWEVKLSVEAAQYGAVKGGHIVLTASVQPLRHALAASKVFWAGRRAGHQTGNIFDHGIWAKEDGSENRLALILLADSPDDRKAIEAGLESKQPESELLLVGMLPLTIGELVGVRGIIAEPLVGDTSVGSYRRRGSFQLRAGKKKKGGPGSENFKFFDNAEKATLKIV
ncbi:hypothetical protein MMYC01_204545 [Madurella mycetomatis]|uniref:Heterokaryon incompatibility domain-containing protein n=1 Tax=Madurella mycetomatis TaxID=100816 RepID=A0A175VWH7_9PEZI|nr:hypothetical protein MMYC01_207988 [Madurella mycetomatis]KXX79318.1 hypothetical protein MMYC01_204545 [Madurella mycetomatis]